MTTQKIITITRPEVGKMIKAHLDSIGHRFGGITYSSHYDSFRLTDMDGETTIDDVFKAALGSAGYVGYTTKFSPKNITVIYNVD